MLFSYFPTKVRFPYPVVAHATVELTSNRQNLIDSKANRFLIHELAEALAEVAEQSISDDDPWRPLRLIANRGTSVDPMLETLGFHRALVGAAKSRMVVPRRDGSLAISSTVRRLPVDSGDWLPLEGFADLALWTEDYGLRQVLEHLGVASLSPDQFRERADILSPRLNLAERIAILAGLIRHSPKGCFPKSPPPRLLVDKEGAVVELGIAAYFPPTAETPFRPPPWMPLRFLPDKLVDGLMLSSKHSRERLAEELREAGFRDVHAYDFGGIASALVAQTNRRCRDNPDNEEMARREGILALRDLYRSVGNTGVPTRDAGLKIALPTRNAEWQNADALYFGDPYPRGAIMEALLGKQHAERFVADLCMLEGGSDAASWEDFLLWTGVAVFPRTEQADLSSWPNSEYVSHVRQEAKYPIPFGEFEVGLPDQLAPVSIQALRIQHADEILAEPDHHAIIAWIALDPRFDDWHRDGDSTARIEARFKERTYRTAQHAVPSHVLWLLRNSPWLLTVDGSKQPPIRCVYARAASQELHRIFPCPAVDPDHRLFSKLGISRESLTTALLRLGIHMTLDGLSWEQCYKVMLELPHIDPEGVAATRVYRILVAKEEPETSDNALVAIRKEFVETGKLWCRARGEWAYRSVKEGVYCAGDPTMPPAVLDAFPTLDLPRGRGMDKIARIFAVRILRGQDMAITVESHDVLPQWKVLDDQLSRLKPYVLAIRLDSTPDVVGIGRFRKLAIVACSRLSGHACVNNTELPISMNTEGDSLICENQAYLVVSSTVGEPRLANFMIARHVAIILAAVLQVERTGDFAQLAFVSDGETRRRLLSEILGHDAADVLQKAKEELQVSLEEDEGRWSVDLNMIRKATKQENDRRDEDVSVITESVRPVPPKVDVTPERSELLAPSGQLGSGSTRTNPLWVRYYDIAE